MSNDKTNSNDQCPRDDRAQKFDLRERLLKFSKRILEIVNLLPRTPENDIIRRQLTAAGTSVGANYEEADGAITKRDFIHKMAIARKEAKETRYWLTVISDSVLPADEISKDLKEAGELVSILSSIINKTRKGN